jgi:hypothetical protein
MKPNKKIYVTDENDGTPDQYWQVNQTPEEAAPPVGEKRKVYVYELKEALLLETKVVVK